MKKRIFGVLFTFVLLLSLVMAVPVGAAGTPTIDGVLGVDEWGSPDFSNFYDGYLLYNVYVLDDDQYLYVAFEAGGGDFTIASSMTNIYTYAGGDYAGECWAYSVAGWVGDVGLDYFTIHHIQPPKVKEGKEARSTTAIVGIAPTVMEWRIPLAEIPSSPGSSLAFDFMAFIEGWSNNHGSWDAAWLYEQEYTLSLPTKADILSGVPGKGLDTAPGLQKPFNPKSQAGDNAGKK
jgi:hypothetical protein